MIDTTMPAIAFHRPRPARFGGFAAHAARWLALAGHWLAARGRAIAEHNRERQDLEWLACQNEQMLRDIGVSRSEVLGLLGRYF